MIYPAKFGMKVMINTLPLPNGIKDGAGDYGFIIENYLLDGLDYFVIDTGNGQELHFTREHFEIVEEP
jgi:hypothetical protein